MSGPKLSIEIESKRFDAATPLLSGFSLTVEPSSVLALVGPSGVGKSTLLRMIGGIDTLFTGSITLDGLPAAQAPPPGYVFQDPRLLPWLTALDNVRIVRKETTRMEAAEMLHRVGLAGYENAYPHQLSGGMQRRVAIARAFSVNSALLLLDEPFVSLDRSLVKEVEAVLQSLLDATQPTAMLVTHLPDDAAMLADRVVVMSGRPARIIADLRFESRRGARSRTELEHIANQIAAASLELA